MAEPHTPPATSDACSIGIRTEVIDGVLGRLDRWIAERPEAPAVVEAGTTYSFGDIDAGARALRSHLTELGTDGELVGVCLPRSAAVVTAAVGIARAGAVYVPLGTSAPAERMVDLITDAGIRVVIVAEDSVLVERLAEIGVGVVTVPRDIRQWSRIGVAAPGIDPAAGSGQAVSALARAAGDRALYGVHTSGSTGRPKVVIVGHRALANLVSWFTETYSLDGASRMGFLVSETFDVHLMEFWSSLYAGSALVVVDDETRVAPTALATLFRAERVNVCFLPTPLGEAFLKREWQLPDLRHLLLGGDRMREWVAGPAGTRIHNQYGPAEACVVSTSFALGPECSADPPPIGYPVHNAVAYVVGESGRLLSRGESGELYIGGSGVALGYLNRPELNAERFLPDAWGSTGGLCYRTGDHVRMRPDGALEFLGRLDDQVKIRGIRIEPGEIEGTLHRHPSVREAAVIVVESGSERRLAAFVVPETPALHEAALRSFLAATLPDYMVPATIDVLPELPLTQNAKIDRAALRIRLASTPDTRGYVPPAPGVEATLADVWAEVLNVERVGATDNFLALGGQSLLAVQVLQAVEQGTGRRLSMRAFMRARDLREVGAMLEPDG